MNLAWLASWGCIVASHFVHKLAFMKADLLCYDIKLLVLQANPILQGAYQFEI